MQSRWVVLVAACGHGPPPKSVAAERPVQTIADLAGRWVSSNDLDWGYSMTIGPDGIEQWIDRGRMGRCEQKAKTLRVAPNEFDISYTREECYRDPLTDHTHQLHMKVTSFTGDVLTIELKGDGVDEHHVYRRAPQ